MSSAVKKYKKGERPEGSEGRGGVRPWSGHPVVEAFQDPEVEAVVLDWHQHGYDSQASARNAVYSLLRRKFPNAKVSTSAIGDTELMFEVKGNRKR
jgi:hypothetical protein